MADKTKKWCFCWLAKVPTGPGADRAALHKAAMWTPGDTITVAFLDGDAALQKRVKEAALQWTDPAKGNANLTLLFQNDASTALIRISFQYEGSWSTLGTTCKQVTDKTEPTMNYGWLTTASTDVEVREVVLHEFGHALGLIHEHQSPNAGISWNKAVVNADLSVPPNGWTQEQIDFNMYKAYEQGEVNATAFDPQSIMLYSFPATWTTTGLSTPTNTDLSTLDKKLIQKYYP